MRERSEQILRIVCLILAACVLYRLAGTVIRSNPLRGAKVPALPTLITETNSPSSGGKTNLAAKIDKKTNVVLHSTGTNSPATTNVAVAVLAANTNGLVAEVRVEPTNNIVTNVPPESATNLVSSLEMENRGTNTLLTPTAVNDTNLATATVMKNTNLVAATEKATNALSHSDSEKKATNSPPKAVVARPSGQVSRPGTSAIELSPAIQARITKITDSEILGAVIRPQPMALLGIAGDVAFLRSPSGQTGLVKEGDSLGELKLLKIGINRVLVEVEGQEKELMIFSGYGGESLLTKPKESSDETSKK